MNKISGICLVFVTLFMGSVRGVEWVPINSFVPVKIEVSVIQAGPDRMTMRLDLPGFFVRQVEIGGEKHVVVLHPDAPAFLEKGLPGLPRKNMSVMIPHDRDVAVSIVNIEYRNFRLGPIAPSKGSFTRNQQPSQVPYEFDLFYETDQWYPSENVKLGKSFILRDIRGINVQFQPFQYNPSIKVLRVAMSMVVEVRPKTGIATNPRIGKKPRRKNQDFEKLYTSVLANYSASDYQLSMDIPEPGELVIIAYDEFVDAVEPLSQWKIQKGIPTTVVPLGDIGYSSEDIKAFLQSLYDEGRLTYVILVGDADEVPVLWGTTEVASDPSYVMLEGDDFYPDAFISRISASSVDQVDAQVAKFIAYEKTPSEGDWYYKGIAIGSNEGADVPPDYLRDWERAEILREMLLDYTYREIDQFYDPGASRAELIDSLNSGRSIVNYLGHGSGTMWATTGFHVSHASKLTNGGMLPFIIDVSSLNGQWHDRTCLAEAFLLNPDGGAIGMFSSSISPSWIPPTIMQKRVVELIVSEEKLTMGSLTMNGSIHALEAYNSGREGIAIVEEYNLFGDCTLPIRTAKPTPLYVSHSSFIVPGSSTFSVSTTTPDALIALSMNGKLYGVGVTSESGGAVIHFPGQIPQLGPMTLTATARNSIPYVTSIPVMQPLKPYVSVDSYIINDEYGNNDGTADFGETVGVRLIFKNNALLDAHQVRGKVSTSDPYVVLIDSSCGVEEILAGTAIRSIDEIVFQVSPQTPDGHLVQFSVEITTRAIQGIDLLREDIFMIPIEAPILKYLDHSVKGETSEGFLKTSEMAQVIVTIVNNGAESARNIEMKLEAESDYISIIDGETFFSAIQPAGGISTNLGDPFIIITDEDAPLGMEVPFHLQMREESGYIASSKFTLTVGNNIFSSEDVPKEFGPKNIESLLRVEESFILSDVDVMVDISHKWVEDVVLKLESPLGTTVTLLSEVGGTGNDFQGTIFDDEATPSITDGSPPFVGSYRPEEPLSILDGENALGQWKLHVIDKYPYSDHGTLNAWSLILRGAEPLCKRGDVNDDGTVDMLDVAMVISIILGALDNPSEQELCAADYDSDGEILILDTIKMMNDIFGIQLAKEPIATEAILIRRGNTLSFQSNGTIAGLQFVLETDGTVIPLEIPGASVSVNRKDTRIKVVVYSPEKSGIPEGGLLHITGDFIVLNIKAADRRGNLAKIDYINLPFRYELYPNYPNPFNPTTIISFDLPDEAKVKLVIYDVLGREVKRLVSGKMVSGRYLVRWNAEGVPSGIYFYQLTINQSQLILTKKMLIMK